MDASDFSPEAPGVLVPTMDGQLAFVPAPLPPNLTYDSQMVLALSRADSALSELSGLGRYLPNPRLLIVPYTRREAVLSAVLSSRIEGTRASLSEVLRDEVTEDLTDTEDADLREVRNYIVALEHGIRRLETLPLSLRLIREMHERLLEGVRGEQGRPASSGEYKTGLRQRERVLSTRNSSCHRLAD